MYLVTFFGEIKSHVLKFKYFLMNMIIFTGENVNTLYTELKFEIVMTNILQKSFLYFYLERVTAGNFEMCNFIPISLYYTRSVQITAYF